MNLEDIYQRAIVAHAQSPRWASLPARATARARRQNPLCGDCVEVAVCLAGDRIVEVGVVARACLICVAVGSMMAERVRGASSAEAEELAGRFQALVGAGSADDLGELSALRPLQEVPSRRPCALLPWQTLLAALATARAKGAGR